ncbi:hypothetical protein [Gallaecimonas mangrovi]|uniref:hypothetical protein n=1 Tax=Gallaecimonas mangrovi TaxID=2291597 RepID=UPI000E201CE8|nr:hypothetical protein [Gallaecimonas mangrovi]
MNRLFLAFFILVVPLSSQASFFCSSGSSLSDISKSLDQAATIRDEYFSSNSEVILDKGKEIYTRVFNDCLSNFISSSFDKLNSKDLHRLYSYIDEIAFYTKEEAHVDLLSKILYEKARRKEYITNIAQDVYNKYIVSRNLEKASKIDSDFNVKIKSNYIYHHYDDRGLLKLKNGIFEVENITTKNDSKIIVISSPFCHFSNNFLDWIEGKKETLDTFKNKATFIIPSNSTLDKNPMKIFKKLHPWTNVGIAYKESEWPEIKNWDTPTFYFYKNGNVVDIIYGWPKKGRADELKNALENLKKH